MKLLRILVAASALATTLAVPSVADADPNTARLYGTVTIGSGLNTATCNWSVSLTRTPTTSGLMIASGTNYCQSKNVMFATYILLQRPGQTVDWVASGVVCAGCGLPIQRGSGSSQAAASWGGRRGTWKAVLWMVSDFDSGFDFERKYAVHVYL